MDNTLSIDKKNSTLLPFALFSFVFSCLGKAEVYNSALCVWVVPKCLCFVPGKNIVYKIRPDLNRFRMLIRDSHLNALLVIRQHIEDDPTIRWLRLFVMIVTVDF